MKFIARVQSMASEEVLRLVPPDTLARIKQKDETPLFRAYVIGEEGDASHEILGLGSRVLHWFRSAVTKIVDKLTFGTQLFHNHQEGTNEHKGRVPIGEIVGKTLRTIKDKLSAIAIAYIYPDFRNIPLDIASFEAEIKFPEKGNEVTDAEVIEITGIALGNSSVNKPGFAGATLLAEIRAFANNHPQGGGEMTLSEIQKAIQESKFRLSDVFDPRVMLNDPFISELIKEESEKLSRVKGYESRKAGELEAELKKIKEESEKQIKEKDGKIAQLELASATMRVGELFAKKKEERKLDERQTKFLEAKMKKFVPQKAEEVEKELDAYLDSQIDEFKTVAKDVFGIEEEKKTDAKGGEANVRKESGSASKYLDPDLSPLD